MTSIHVSGKILYQRKERGSVIEIEGVKEREREKERERVKEREREREREKKRDG